ncbi:MAG: hypothetical protein WEA75_03575 [Acidimicrobiia bacterium]
MLVGTLGNRHRAAVDERGVVSPTHTGWDLDWWIGADDRWRVPHRETAVRQGLVDGAPIPQTAMRVPGGDAVQRVYGVVADGDPIVVEVENASPAPFVVALVIRGARDIALDGSTVMVDGCPALVSTRAPSRWAHAIGRSTEVEVLSGAARAGPFPRVRHRSGRVEATFLHPIPHRTSLRVALLGRRDAMPKDLRALPDAATVARGWRIQLDRGMRVDLPDPALVDAARAACAEALLGATARVPDENAVAALEDWGFDSEVTASWTRLSGRQRRRAARRPQTSSSWADVCAARERSAASLLLALRSFLVHEGDDVITLLADLPDDWRGGSIEVHGAPTRRGLVSYAVRWHGDRAAVLWDGPGGVTVRAPGLDARWSSTDPRGEALLA